MRIYNKKGVIEAQFNWIFILVVGGIILLFFISLVSSQKKASDLTSNSELLNHLDSIIKGASISVGTVYDISMPLSQALSNDCVGQALTFDKSKIQGLDMSSTVFFGPGTMSGSKIFTYSLYWQEPYTITPFLYLTTDSVLFFVVNSSKLHDVYYELPVNGDYDAVDEEGNVRSVLKYGENNLFSNLDDVADLINNADNEYFTHIKIITTETPPVNDFFTSNPKAKIIVYTIPDIPSYEGYFKARITVYKRNGDIYTSEVVNLLGFPSLMGLFFSDSLEEYECNMGKALRKYDIISLLQKQKSINLSKTVEDSNGFYSGLCIPYYSDFDHEVIVDGVSASFGSNGELNLTMFDSFDDSIETLRNYNIKLGDKSCPVPY